MSLINYLFGMIDALSGDLAAALERIADLEAQAHAHPAAEPYADEGISYNMARTTVTATNNREREFEVCDLCGFFLDGVRNCGYCGEPKCPVCGCLCPGTAEWDNASDDEENTNA